MNAHRPRDPLSTTLRTWQPEPVHAPDFVSGVWARIHSVNAAPVARRTALLPLAASIAVTLSILAGSATALGLNRARSTDLQAAAYVRSIDPLQMSALHAASSPSSTAPAASAHPHS